LAARIVGETVTRVPDPPEDDAGIERWIAEVRRMSDAGELLEEIPWDAEEEALLAEAWDELDAELKQEEAIRAAKYYSSSYESSVHEFGLRAGRPVKPGECHKCRLIRSGHRPDFG
jgi:hypothetical protein